MHQSKFFSRFVLIALLFTFSLSLFPLPSAHAFAAIKTYSTGTTTANGFFSPRCCGNVSVSYDGVTVGRWYFAVASITTVSSKDYTTVDIYNINNNIIGSLNKTLISANQLTGAPFAPKYGSIIVGNYNSTYMGVWSLYSGGSGLAINVMLIKLNNNFPFKEYTLSYNCGGCTQGNVGDVISNIVYNGNSPAFVFDWLDGGVEYTFLINGLNAPFLINPGLTQQIQESASLVFVAPNNYTISIITNGAGYNSCEVNYVSIISKCFLQNSGTHLVQTYNNANLQSSFQTQYPNTCVPTQICNVQVVKTGAGPTTGILTLIPAQFTQGGNTYDGMLQVQQGSTNANHGLGISSVYQTLSPLGKLIGNPSPFIFYFLNATSDTIYKTNCASGCITYIATASTQLGQSSVYPMYMYTDTLYVFYTQASHTFTLFSTVGTITGSTTSSTIPPTTSTIFITNSQSQTTTTIITTIIQSNATTISQTTNGVVGAVTNQATTEIPTLFPVYLFDTIFVILFYRMGVHNSLFLVLIFDFIAILISLISTAIGYAAFNFPIFIPAVTTIISLGILAIFKGKDRTVDAR